MMKMEPIISADVAEDGMKMFGVEAKTQVEVWRQEEDENFL
jgi:hypothetical protein